MNLFVQILAFSINLAFLRAQQQQYFQTDKDSNYNFGFLVDDGESGAQFNQQEQRQQNRTDGSYSVRLPDSRLMKVAYFVDGNSGYVAEISYEGEAQFPDDSRQGQGNQGNSPNIQNSPQFISQGNQPNIQTAALQQSSQFPRQLNSLAQEQQNSQGQFGGFSQGQQKSFTQGGFFSGNSQQQHTDFSDFSQRQQRGISTSHQESTEDQTIQATHKIYKDIIPTVFNEGKQDQVGNQKFPTTVTQGVRDFALEEFIAASQMIPPKPSSQSSTRAESRIYSKNIFKPSQLLKPT